jgi:hypothetical protein
MAITNITTANQTTDETNPITCDIVITDGAGNNRKVVVFITEERSPTQTTVPTLSGVSGVLVDTVTGGSTIRTSLFEWNDVNLPSTSGTYTVSWAVASVDAALSVLSCSGAKQLPCVSPRTAGGSSALTLSYTLIADAGSLALIGLTDSGFSATLTPGANQVAILAPTSTGSATHATSYNATDLTVSYTRGAANTYAVVAAAIEPYYDIPIGWTGV